jgi:hypothetical protein
MSPVNEPTIRHRPDHNVSSLSPVKSVSEPSLEPASKRLAVDARNISLTFDAGDLVPDGRLHDILQGAGEECVCLIGPSG